MQFQEYEQAVAAFYEAIGKPQGLTQVTWNTKLPSKSGQPYQIDVLVEGSNGLQPVRTAIECKHLSKKVERKIVSAFATTIEEIGVEKGVIVTTVGFTEPAARLAKQKNISLVEMRKPTDADWEGRVKEIHFAIISRMPEFSAIEFIQDAPRQENTQSGSFTGNDKSDEIFIKEPGKDQVTLYQLLNDFISVNGDELPVNTEPITREVRFSEGSVMSFLRHEQTAMVDGIRFKVRILSSEETLKIDGTKVVQFIVNEIFQGRRFTVSRSGQVNETTESRGGEGDAR